MKIEKIKGWKLFREKITNGKIYDLSWANTGAGYDTQPVYVKIGPHSIAQHDEYLVYVSVGNKSIGRVGHVKTAPEALKIAYNFMKRNKNIARME